METFEILTHPDSRLRLKASPIKTLSDEYLKIAKKMLATMYLNNGIGLAATQVNIQKRIIVIDVSDEKNNPIFLFNPEIVDKEGKIQYQEGCLSVPGIFEKVERFEQITYQAIDLNGKIKTDTASGLLAICIQHEIDHLDGKLFVDYLSVLKQTRILKKAKAGKEEKV